MSWRAADLTADRSWHLEWDHRELSALDAWASVTSGEDPDELVAALAGAPEILVERAEAVRSELINGYGLVLLSGLDVGKYDRKSIAVMFMLFGSLIGSLRSQNAAGHLLGHVTDVGADVDDPATRIYQTNQRQTFHTDSTDAVGLLCLRTAKEGGVSMVVSVDAVYERLAAEAPKLAARLFEPIATDRRNEQPDGELPWFEIPVLSPSGDRVTGIYQRQYIDSAQRFEDAPRPDEETLLALDAFDAIMNDPTMRFQMDLAPGDMQFVHNHSLLHDRTGFIDHDDPELRRYLLRVWLSLPGDRELPAVFEQRYGTTTVGDRGGIVVPGTTPTIQLPG
ncbi:MAG: TauD/TfdA family dioxygenase [Acidimicrobiaceae bacterium]|nr:TauD/TfdA family dioxygenase [Acidimicrobiaceae bacterium]